jgi:cytochrome c biogenesis protein CcdA
LLAAVLSYVAFKGSMAFGALLLFFYGLGAGAPVIALGTVFATYSQRLALLGRRRWVDGISGVVLIVMSLYLLWIA